LEAIGKGARFLARNTGGAERFRFWQVEAEQVAAVVGDP
jgi:hypothetical protein